jgi:SAM-dependent methyltransferase
VKRTVAALDRELLHGGSHAAMLQREVGRAFAELVQCMRVELGEESSWSDAARDDVGARVQAEVLPIMLLSDNGERWYAKPRGYAGDYLSIDQMYDDVPRGHGRVGITIDRCFLDLAAVRAVQNRRALVAAEIRATIDACSDRPARVTSLACGPARELFDVYGSLRTATMLESTLVDIDLHALAHVADRRDRSGLKRQMRLLPENLVHLCTGRTTPSFAEQDLVYSIGLIDYFDDAFVVKLMDVVHDALRPGGRAVLGNFHPRNETRAFMDHVLDWKLVHRTPADMDRLYRASRFGRACTRVVFETEGINLFAECVREP